MTAPAELRTRTATDEQAPARGRAPVRPPAMPRPVPPVPRVAPVPPVAAVRPVAPVVSVGARAGRPAVVAGVRVPGVRVVHLVLAVVVTLVVVGVLGWLGQVAGSAVPAETAVARVGAGETVWDVAERMAPESDPRGVVQRIRELNDLTGSAVQPGQQLRVPDGR